MKNQLMCHTITEFLIQLEMKQNNDVQSWIHFIIELSTVLMHQFNHYLIKRNRKLETYNVVSIREMSKKKKKPNQLLIIP